MNNNIVSTGTFKNSKLQVSGIDRFSNMGPQNTTDIFMVSITSSYGLINWTKSFGGLGDESIMLCNKTTMGTTLVVSFRDSVTIDDMEFVDPRNDTINYFVTEISPEGVALY